MYMSRLYTDARLHQVVNEYCGRERELATLQALCVAVHIDSQELRSNRAILSTIFPRTGFIQLRSTPPVSGIGYTTKHIN